MKGKTRSFAIVAPPPDHNNGWRIWLPEFIVGFLWVSFVLSVKYHQTDAPNLLLCFMTGFSLFGLISTHGTVSGACINPAIGFVQPIFAHLMEKQYRSVHPNEPESSFNKYALDNINSNIGYYLTATLVSGAVAGSFQTFSTRFGQILSGEIKDTLEQIERKSTSQSEAN